eukprot:5580131-Heterocapsa_arctica.AAC.1
MEEDGHHWNRVKGHMAATIATLIDIGRQPLSACYWGDSQVTRIVNDMVWARASTHHQGAGLDKGAFLCSVTKVVRSFEKSAVPVLAGMALCVAAG